MVINIHACSTDIAHNTIKPEGKSSKITPRELKERDVELHSALLCTQINHKMTIMSLGWINIPHLFANRSP